METINPSLIMHLKEEVYKIIKLRSEGPGFQCSISAKLNNFNFFIYKMEIIFISKGCYGD